jgi:ferredoxin-NADP reductase
MPQPWRMARIIRIKDETPSTKRFWFELPELDNFEFTPGQFVTLDLPIHEKPAKRWRSYSIASWPDGSNIFELVIVLLENGAGTNYLFKEVEVGSEIPCRGPQGVFTLPNPIEKDLFFICTGTGIAPFRSMAHHILLNNIPHKNIYLIFGCRLFCDGLYGKELMELENKMLSFNYIPTYSREDGENIRKGYVHAVYEEIIMERGKPDAAFYLCGWKNMIDEAKQRIIALGYDRKAIHQELYG